jgi:hypothetical protein
VAADALAEDVEGESRIVGIGPHLGPAGDLVHCVGRDEIQLAEHLAVHVPQVGPVVQAQTEAGAGPDRLGGGSEPEATSEHRIGGQESLHGSFALERQE